MIEAGKKSTHSDEKSNLVNIKNVVYSPYAQSQILNQVNIQIKRGSFLALLGENGAGKTTLLDLIMGFKKATSGEILVASENPAEDSWLKRQKIAYLSEKMDIPGDWSVQNYLDFNRFFYKDYSVELENEYLKEFRVSQNDRLGNMSAGEVRRVQIVGALALQPELIIVDEITAVLDIVGRSRFLARLAALNQEQNCTIILATNILEELDRYITDIGVMKNGQVILFEPINNFLNRKPGLTFTQLVTASIENI